MMSMSMRPKNMFVLLIAFLVFGASSQAVACEMACASAARSHCYQAIVRGSDTMEMHCAGAMNMTSAVAACVHGHHENSCDQFPVLTFEKTASAGILFADMRWDLVEIQPLRPMMHGRDWNRGWGSPPRHTRFDPLTVSLRV